MSQPSVATVRAGARPLHDGPPARSLREHGDGAPRPSLPSLRVVRSGRLRGGSAGFAIVCGSVLALGLLVLLLINTTLSQRAFTLHSLQTRSAALADTQDALAQQLAQQRSPQQLAELATKMGMVPAQTVAFLRLSDGKVLGVAKPAQPQLGFSVVADPSVSRTQARQQTTAASSRVSAAERLPTTKVINVSTSGPTTTTDTTTTVTDAAHNTIRTTVVSDAVTLVKPQGGGATTTVSATTTTVRTVHLTIAGEVTTVRVTGPDGATRSSTQTTPIGR